MGDSGFKMRLPISTQDTYREIDIFPAFRRQILKQRFGTKKVENTKFIFTNSTMGNIVKMYL